MQFRSPSSEKEYPLITAHWVCVGWGLFIVRVVGEKLSVQQRAGALFSRAENKLLYQKARRN